MEKPRFEAYDHQPLALVAAGEGWANYARQLGAAADGCAVADPLLSPARVLETLEAVPLPEDATPLPPARLLRLAASASRRAALSSRQEIYPRGMAPLQALRQSIGAFAGAPFLRVKELRDRVNGRYPEASPLPDRPELDRLLETVEAPLRWDSTAFNEPGYVSLTLGRGPTAGSTTQYSRDTTQLDFALGRIALPEADVVAAQDLESRLQRSTSLGSDHGSFLVLTVEPRLARHAEAELLHRFGEDANVSQPLRRVSFDTLLLGTLRDAAAAARVDWNVVLRADAAESGSQHWRNLLRLVKRALPPIQSLLLHSSQPLLLVNCGLLARYELMSLVEEMRDSAGRLEHTPTIWMLLPSHQQGLPRIDGVPVPLINPSHAVSVPLAWIENKHRSAAATAA